jgi:hypothetical protein
MILRHVWAGLALAAVFLAAGCCCHKSGACREACAPPCCAGPGVAAGAPPVQSFSSPAPVFVGH